MLALAKSKTKMVASKEEFGQVASALPLSPRLRRRHGRADATSKYGGDVKKSIFGKAAGQQAVMSTPEGAQAAVAAAGTCQAD